MAAIVSFTRMDQSRADDWALVAESGDEYRKGFADRMFELLHRCDGIAFAHPVTNCQHGLQTATRALRDGADEETIVVALLHDVGVVLSLDNHAELSAALLRPYISDENYWLVGHHGLFQGYYYFHLIGRDRDERDRFRGHPAFQRTVDFCERWDQPAFDPAYDTAPLATFEPMARRVLGREPRWVE